MSLGRLGDYEILERIGQGGMGVVFKARDTRLDRVVALKALSASLAVEPEYRARLVREARAEACLSHPHIAVCFEVGEAAPVPADLLEPGVAGPHPATVSFLAMEFVPGEDLISLIERRPKGVIHQNRKGGHKPFNPFKGRTEALTPRLLHRTRGSTGSAPALVP